MIRNHFVSIANTLKCVSLQRRLFLARPYGQVSVELIAKTVTLFSHIGNVVAILNTTVRNTKGEITNERI